MKKLIQFSFLGMLSMMLIYSCAKNTDAEILTETDQIQLMDIGAEPALPDLIVSSLTSNLTVSDGPCPGGPKADATCNGPGGSVPVQFTAIVKNITGVAVPAGTPFIVDFCLAGGACNSITWNQGVPANGSVTVMSTASALPCPTGPGPYQLITRQFYSVADAQDDINEFKENNNYSRRYFVCDDED